MALSFHCRGVVAQEATSARPEASGATACLGVRRGSETTGVPAAQVHETRS